MKHHTVINVIRGCGVHTFLLNVEKLVAHSSQFIVGDESLPLLVEVVVLVNELVLPDECTCWFPAVWICIRIPPSGCGLTIPAPIPASCFKKKSFTQGCGNTKFYYMSMESNQYLLTILAKICTFSYFSKKTYAYPSEAP